MSNTLQITFLTMFPELLDGLEKNPVIARALRNGAVKLRTVDIKEYAGGSFRHIDDSPFGGGSGMIMRVQPVLDALHSVLQSKSDDADTSSRPLVCALTPAGRPYTQQTARRYAEADHLILLCGHYEGMDERIYSHVDERVSIGDYILTGGEPAAAVIADSVIRLLPGVLKEGVTQQESFESGLLEYPQYTQPADYNGDIVPEILLSGDHEKIRQWRYKEALRLTEEYRPDLLKKVKEGDIP